MKNIFIVYGHYNQSSFNAAIKNTFTEAAKKKGDRAHERHAAADAGRGGEAAREGNHGECREGLDRRGS